MKWFILLLFGLIAACQSPAKQPSTELMDGKELAFAREKGNCLACHRIEDGELPGNIGPELVNIRSRFKNKTALRAQIWDATAVNPETSMPPFGKNKILSSPEIDRIVDYLWSL